MAFWTYMLRCADDSFYIGHTDDIDTRLDAHHAGLGSYTSTRRPVMLAWSQEFETRVEALAVERQLKGWNRSRKKALIASDRETIRKLAWGKRNPYPK